MGSFLDAIKTRLDATKAKADAAVASTIPNVLKVGIAMGTNLKTAVDSGEQAVNSILVTMASSRDIQSEVLNSGASDKTLTIESTVKTAAEGDTPAVKGILDKFTSLVTSALSAFSTGHDSDVVEITAHNANITEMITNQDKTITLQTLVIDIGNIISDLQVKGIANTISIDNGSATITVPIFPGTVTCTGIMCDDLHIPAASI